MARRLRVSVRYGGETYDAAVEHDERADQLLLRSLYHFGLDPREKRGWRLVPEGVERPGHGVYLEHAIGEQVSDGAALTLEADVAGNRRLSTGSY